MNYNEKKALYSFLLIYVSSTMLFIGIMLSSYYKRELIMYDKQCSIIMTNAASTIKTNILKAHMDKNEFVPVKLKDESLKYALYTKDKKLIYKDTNTAFKDFSKTRHFDGKFTYHLSKFEDKYENKINIKYILIETQQAYSDKFNLQILVISILLISIVFILVIGYFLSKLLLKPVREKVLLMDNFIKDSAHELNTPIAVLLMSASTLKQGRNQEKMLQYIVSSAKQVSHIYNDIHFCAFNDIDEDLNQNFDLEEVLCESIGYFKDIAVTKNIIIETESNKSMVYMDKNKTQRIINNLLSNAIKYSNKNSKILISLDDYVFKVQDYGIGISKQDQSNIFKRYKRGTTIEGGFGIGLDIVNRIIKEYKLKLSLVSKEKEGSTFMVDFNNVKYIKQ